MNITLVRHGQASFGKANYDELSSLGHQQAQWLGEHFAAHSVQHQTIYHGSLVRHQQTFAGIEKGLQSSLSSQVQEGLNEFDFESVVRAYLSQHPSAKPDQHASVADYYRVLKAAMHDWASARLEGQVTETWQDFSQRVRAVLDVARQQPHQQVLMVTSGGVIAMMVADALGLDATGMIKLNMQIRNASLSQLKLTATGSHLVLFNAVPHLEHPTRQHAITYS